MAGEGKPCWVANTPANGTLEAATLPGVNGKAMGQGDAATLDDGDMAMLEEAGDMVALAAGEMVAVNGSWLNTGDITCVVYAKGKQSYVYHYVRRSYVIVTWLACIQTYICIIVFDIYSITTYSYYL